MAVEFDFFLIYDIAGFDSEVTAHAVERDILSSFDDDLLHHGSALEKDSDLHAITKGFGKDAHVGHAAGLVESAHILLRSPLAVGLADFGGEVRENTILGNTRSADGLHGDILDHWTI